MLPISPIYMQNLKITKDTLKVRKRIFFFNRFTTFVWVDWYVYKKICYKKKSRQICIKIANFRGNVSHFDIEALIFQ